MAARYSRTTQFGIPGDFWTCTFQCVTLATESL